LTPEQYSTVKLHYSKAFTAERNSNGKDIADQIVLFVSQSPDVSVAGQNMEQRRLSLASSQANCGVLLHVFFIYIFLPSAASVGRWEVETLVQTAESAQNKKI
jgi:hypothetical protein